MVVFLSSEWVDAFNEALADHHPASIGSSAVSPTPGRPRQMAQEVHGTPSGEPIRTRLDIGPETLHLQLEPNPDEPPGAPPVGTPQVGTPPLGTPPGPVAESAGDRSEPDVTIRLHYTDAAAMAAGTLDPAEAIAAGRVKVRGDVSVLMSAHAALGGASERLEALRARTIFPSDGE